MTWATAFSTLDWFLNLTLGWLRRVVGLTSTIGESTVFVLGQIAHKGRVLLEHQRS